MLTTLRQAQDAYDNRQPPEFYLDECAEPTPDQQIAEAKEMAWNAYVEACKAGDTSARLPMAHDTGFPASAPLSAMLGWLTPELAQKLVLAIEAALVADESKPSDVPARLLRTFARAAATEYAAENFTEWM